MKSAADRSLNHSLGSSVAPNNLWVLGAGIMGAGIAYEAARAGVSVCLYDRERNALEKARHRISDWQSKAAVVDSVGTEPRALGTHSLLCIDYRDDFSGLRDADIIIEAITERADLKIELLKEVDRAAGSKSILATNTSTYSIDLLGADLTAPERFCGIHFFNPVTKMPLVELIGGQSTSLQTLAKAEAFAVKLKKIPVRVANVPGFLVNRILFTYLRGVVQLVAQGADFVRIDRLMEAYGWPMGPAALIDLIGIDTTCAIDAVLTEAYPDRMTAPAPELISRLMSQNLLGRKAGQGFYSYADSKAPVPNPLLRDWLDSRPESAFISDQELQLRLLAPFFTESLRCIEESVVESAEQLDQCVQLGLGFPSHRIGPLAQLDRIGLDHFIEQLKPLNQLGSLYQVRSWVEKRARAGIKFY